MQTVKPYLAMAARRALPSRWLVMSARMSQQAPKEPSNPVLHPSKSAESAIGNLTNLDKRVLVWTKKYKSIEEIPATVHREKLERARNEFRIKVCNIMVVLTIIGCGIMIWSGKEAQKRGESVAQMNLDWHKQINETPSKKE